jgi:arylsulfatase A-like enzyme
MAALVASAALVPTSHGAPSTPGKPNVVLILADDLGYSDLACYGARDVRTPHIDRLAAAGMKFTHFYANSSVCSPSRAALLTGRYPELVGVPGVIRTHADNSWGHLAADAVLLPTLLKKAGYHTALVGKWHLGLKEPNTPTARGFDHFHGFLGDMMDDYFSHRRHGINYLRLGDRQIDPKGHATDLFTQWAVEDIRKQAAQGPFLLYLAFNAPHDPLQPTAAALERVQAREPQLGEKRAKLLAQIEHLDEGVGQVLDGLQQAGVAENTLVLFGSDNGGSLPHGASNGALRDGKGSMYEGGLRVPCCARWPGHITPGTTERVALSMDLFPTICDAAGVRIRHEIEGRSLLPTLLGKEQPAEDRDLFFIRREGGVYQGKTIHALRRGDWKLVQNQPGGPLELYNLKDDPGERRDVGKEQPEVFRAMAEALQEHVRQRQRVPWRQP